MTVSEAISRSDKGHVTPPRRLRCLNPGMVEKIDDAACRVGQYGEVRLVIVKGELRFIHITVSEMLGDQKGGQSDA